MAIQTSRKPIDLEAAKREADEAAGAAKAAIERLKALGFQSREEAMAEVARLDAEVARLDAEAQAAYEAFRLKWGEALSGN